MPFLRKGKEMRKAKETKKVQGKANKDSNAAGKGSGTTSGAKLTAVFWNCGKTGHFRRDCKQKPIHDGKKKTPGNKDGRKGKDKGDGKNKGGKGWDSAWSWVIVEWSRTWGSSGFSWFCFQEVILFWKFSGWWIFANLSWRRHVFDLRSSMQTDLVFLEVVISSHSCCALHLDAPALVWRTSFIQLWSHVKRSSVQPDCIGRFLGFESFPLDFKISL